MEKYFLEILHKGEVMNETSLEMLKGGFGSATDCSSLTSCGCYKGNAVACIGNKKDKPEPLKPSTDTTGSTTIKP